MTTSKDLFHNYFHGGKDYLYGANVHFEDNVFFSYATTIALTETSDDGDEWLLISSNSMSSTTAKHLYALREACPHDRILPIPLTKGDRVFDIRDVACVYAGYARGLEGSTFKKRDTRLDFIRVHDAFLKFLELFKSQLEGSKDYLDRATSTMAGLREKCDAIENRLKASQERAANRTPEEVEAMREKRRLAEERKQERAKAMTADIMKIPYLERVRLLFDPASVRERPSNIPLYAWKVARQLMVSNNYEKANSFIWPLGDRQVKTSQGVIVNLANVLAAIRAYKQSKSTAGLSIDGFGVAAVTENYVRVGCHHIPVENIREFAKAYGINW